MKAWSLMEKIPTPFKRDPEGREPDREAAPRWTQIADDWLLDRLPPLTRPEPTPRWREWKPRGG